LRRAVVTPEVSEADERLYLAGQTVGAGTYREIRSGREVVITTRGTLPATFDGRVAEYVRRTPVWAEIRRGARALGK
jgi:hypothetical protein